MQQACVQMDLHDDYCLVSANDRLLWVSIPQLRPSHHSVDYNGVVPEKWDAVKLSHLVDAEYGNQGLDFKLVPREGFGWTNGEFSTTPRVSKDLADLCLFFRVT
jgi:hypothetical protein